MLGAPTLLAGHNDAGKTAILDAIAFLLGSYNLTSEDPTYVALADGVLGGGPDGPATTVDRSVVTGTFELSEFESDELGLEREARVRRIATEGSARLEVSIEVPTDERLRNYGALQVAELKTRLDELNLSTSGLKSDLQARLDEAAARAPKIWDWVPASGKLSRALPSVQRFDATSSINAEDAIRGALDSAYKAHLADEEIRGSVRGVEEQLEQRLVEDADALKKHIQAVCGDIGEVTIRPRISFAGGLKSTEVSVSNSRGDDVRLTQAGAGRARRVALAVWQFTAKVIEESDEDTVILYDEPDTHLDYSHQRDFIRLLHEQSKLSNVRVVMATHSMNLIDGIDISNVVHVYHANFRTVADSLVDESDVGAHLGAIAASLGLRNTVLLHERLFVGVEGASEARALPVLFRLVTGLQLESCGIALWPCDNNEGALKFAAYLSARGRAVAFVVDADSLKNSKIFSADSLGRHGLDVGKHCLYVGEPNEIEDIFGDELWVKAANQLWPRIDGAPWTAERFATHRSGKFSKTVLEMLRTEASQAPGGKPEMLAQLALTITDPDDVPESLVACFNELLLRAA